MSVTEYEMRLTDLSHYAGFFIPTEVKKVSKFIEGLNFNINIDMARKAEWYYISLSYGHSSAGLNALRVKAGRIW